jgi:sugar/nucleoside kinase (ribokinase family)
MYDLVAIGNPVYDFIKTPYLTTGSRVLSGCSTNAALVAKKLGLEKVGLIGSLGLDYKDRFLSDMKKYDIESLAIIESNETGGFSLIYNDEGGRTLDVLGVASPITSKNLPDEALQTKAILLGPILQEIDLDLIRYIAETSKAKIFLDPQGLIRQIDQNKRVNRICDRKVMKQIAEYIFFFKPNEYESVEITGESDPVKSAKVITEWGAEIAAVTLAHRGSIICDHSTREERIFKIPAYQTVAKDPTGAGDTYAGSFIYAFLQTPETIAANALFASAVASIKVEQSGPDFKVPKDEVQKRVRSLEKELEILH